MNRGFTLIELAAMMAILGLATAMAWPAFRGAARRLETESDAARVEAALRDARVRSMRDGRTIVATIPVMAGRRSSAPTVTFHADGSAQPAEFQWPSTDAVLRVDALGRLSWEGREE